MTNVVVGLALGFLLIGGGFLVGAWIGSRERYPS